MKKNFFLFLALTGAMMARAQNVGINTQTPQAMLHVKDSNVLFSGPNSVLANTPHNPPVEGPGARLMWYPQKAAFRVGLAFGNQWDKDSIGLLSIALGNSTKAKGESSFATGAGTNATGIRSTATGNFTTASGYGSFSSGNQTEASGDYSFAAGSLSNSTGFTSFSFGQLSVATSNMAIAMGINAKAAAFSSLAIGQNVRASGPNSIAFGSSTYSVGNIALAAGYQTKASADYAAVFGSFNDTTETAINFDPQPNDRIFQIGNGLDNTNRKNALTILRNANTGIGTAGPLARLHVADSNVVFTGGSWFLPNAPGNPAVQGQGVRMLWYPAKAAFRSGAVSSNNWNKDSIGKYSFGAGLDVKVKGDYATAFGVNNNSDGWYSFTAGTGNMAATTSGIAIGYNAVARNLVSVAIGSELITKSVYGFSVGFANDTTDFQRPINSPDLDDRIFQIGNGYAGVRKNAITILRNGNTGIGVVIPKALLHASEGSVLFSSVGIASASPANPPVSGAGRRMMWYADKAAFRAGYVDGAQWDRVNTGNYSFAAGYNTLASGNNSTAFGNLSLALGTESIAMGNNAVASGDYAVAIGVGALASGNYSFATGGGTSASGTFSTASGSNSVASGFFSTAMGDNTKAKATASTTLGSNNIAYSDQSLVIGIFNDTTGTNRLFEIGNGSATNARKNALTVLRNGHMGIGNLVPDVPLSFTNTVGSKIAFYSSGVTAQYGMGIQSGLLQIYSDAAASDIVFGHGGSSSFTERMRIKGNGNVGIGTNNPVKPLSFPASLGEKILLYPGGVGEVGIGVYGNELRMHADNPGAAVTFGTQDNAGVFTQAGRFQLSGGYGLFVNGSIWANGTTYASDQRFKQNITAIQNPLQKLIQINGVEYEMKTGSFQKNNFQKGRQMGLLAQNVEQVVPEAVSEKDGYKGVDYARLVPLLIESIKEQQKQQDILKKEIIELKQQIQNIVK